MGIRVKSKHELPQINHIIIMFPLRALSWGGGVLCSCQQYHGKRQAFGRRDGEPHALRKDEHGHQDECRNEEHQAAKEHIDRGAGVLLYGLIVTDDGDVQGKEDGGCGKQRQSARGYLVWPGA